MSGEARDDDWDLPMLGAIAGALVFSWGETDRVKTKAEREAASTVVRLAYEIFAMARLFPEVSLITSVGFPLTH